ncbi:hypothetical protein ABW19_dt0201000 [Dactylella cylindrospora]|nr:hypothetical protein ABW19_dt0201000 [Dactylella cylindrospora]
MRFKPLYQYLTFILLATVECAPHDRLIPKSQNTESGLKRRNETWKEDSQNLVRRAPPPQDTPLDPSQVGTTSSGQIGTDYQSSGSGDLTDQPDSQYYPPGYDGYAYDYAEDIYEPAIYREENVGVPFQPTDPQPVDPRLVDSQPVDSPPADSPPADSQPVDSQVEQRIDELGQQDGLNLLFQELFDSLYDVQRENVDQSNVLISTLLKNNWMTSMAGIPRGEHIGHHKIGFPRKGGSHRLQLPKFEIYASGIQREMVVFAPTGDLGGGMPLSVLLAKAWEKEAEITRLEATSSQWAPILQWITFERPLPSTSKKFDQLLGPGAVANSGPGTIFHKTPSNTRIGEWGSFLLLPEVDCVNAFLEIGRVKDTYPYITEIFVERVTHSGGQRDRMTIKLGSGRGQQVRQQADVTWVGRGGATRNFLFLAITE